MEEMVGTLAYCRAQSDIVCTLRGGLPTWTQLGSGLPCLEFARANPDWVDAPGADTATLNFTTGDFSVGIWGREYTMGATRMLVARGLNNTDGWYLELLATGEVWLWTNQAAAGQNSRSYAGGVVADTWYFIGASRSGANAYIYINGRNLTSTTGTHIDPLTSARELHIGIADDEVSNAFGGLIYRPRVWSRALSEDEWMELYNKERAWFP